MGGGGLSATATFTVSTTGAVTGITVTSGGAGYTAPVGVTITSSTGSGFTGTATLGGPVTVQTGIGPSDGTGPGLVINANLIMGNAAESGTGGGIAFNAVNGADMVAFPDDPGQWNSVTVTNNIIVDNVAGWDGAGISLLDSPNVNIINNTIAFNVSTASAGVLFNTLGAPLASQSGTHLHDKLRHDLVPQVAGVVALQHSAVLMANLAGTPVVCPPGHYLPAAGNPNAAIERRLAGRSRIRSWKTTSSWQNSSYYIGVGASQPAVPAEPWSALSTRSPARPAPNQTATGQCVAAELLGHRRARRHGTDQPRVHVHAELRDR